MTTVDIKEINSSAAELPSEIDEAMEVKTTILVYFSADDALSSQSRKVLHNPESIEGIALSVCDESVASLKVKRHVCPEVSAVQTNIIQRTRTHPNYKYPHPDPTRSRPSCHAGHMTFP